jgi:hypothetical protein
MLEIRSKHNFRGSPYHYIPTEGVAITFIVLYAFSTRMSTTLILFRIPTHSLRSCSPRASHLLSNVVALTNRLPVWSPRDHRLVGEIVVQLLTESVVAFRNAVRIPLAMYCDSVMSANYFQESQRLF